ncbi:methylenetetrahydrofolate reductase [NAD(P)H] [Palleronia sp. LCG004]|uniref:methylenetetrahydrofolate reductase [NAD(P)H] n=1 Tax=Palleronia sp. LCG004 TaxID=3079304 RepID=UPI00294376CF|nr:methylenetetrahydrofolate reductase [NAD(P)H] [Palleronia sp. LCG004]WOI55145.1 methylenetetrahydrofolate reductase [NAD(P)H] [Palleronia sp. LCG004]
MARPTYSFEFFPPKSLEASFRLWDTIHALAPLDPAFVSVTYGAGGTTRELTHEAVTTIGKTTGLRVAAHLTCVNATRDETLAIARGYADAGVTDIVALRGDMPGGAPFEAHPGGFANSVELVEALHATGDFTLHVGAYPDRHPDATTDSSDVEHLKRKVDAGAKTAITQFFFDTETYFRFRDRCVAAGIDAPIIPGILPIENWKGVRKFAASCGTPIPAELDTAFAEAERDSSSDELSKRLATEMCETLIAGGVEHLHFYTLNKPHLTRDVIASLGLAPRSALDHVA